MSLERLYDWKSISGTPSESRTNPGCFDCSICFDYVCDPVVTLCGHLYCWPCIYKWFHTQSDSLSSDEHPTCPVCKTEISHTTLVPLYGRGHSRDLKSRASSISMAIPPRPQAFGTEILATTTSQNGQQLPYRNPYQNQNNEEDYSSSMSYGLNGNTSTGFFHQVVVMFREMFCTRIFGNSENVYRYPNSYLMSSSNSPGLRRQEVQADKSLNRISIFLFCCFLLCLLMF